VDSIAIDLSSTNGRLRVGSVSGVKERDIKMLKLSRSTLMEGTLNTEIYGIPYASAVIFTFLPFNNRLQTFGVTVALPCTEERLHHLATSVGKHREETVAQLECG